MAQFMAPFVGVVEIVCGALLLAGFLTRLATVPLLIDIAVALYSTKIVTLAKNGFWGTLHEARTDVSMLLGLIFLLLVGGGSLALDYRFASKRLEGNG
jgi:putative oxidoreductase